MIIKLCVLLAVLFVCPPVIGSLWLSGSWPWQRRLRAAGNGSGQEGMPGQEGAAENGNIAAAYLYGLFTMLTVFQLLAVPMCFLRTSLTLLVKCYCAALAVLLVLSLVRNRTFAPQRRWLFALRRKVTPALLVVLVCMALQAAFVTQEQHIDEDDALYLATATTSVRYDSLYRRNSYTGRKTKATGDSRYVLASWPIFIAFLARVSHMHPTVLAHMFLPAVVLFWCYLVYFLMAGWLFPGDRWKQGIFMLFTVLLFSFGGFSIYSSAVFPLIRGWQGKAVLAGMGIPALLYGSFRAMRTKGAGLKSWWLLFLTVGAATMFSTMGTMLSCVVVGCTGLACMLLDRTARYLSGCILACLPAIACGSVYFIRVIL